MPDADVSTAIAHWAPRFMQNGVDYNDFQRTTARIESWDQWLPEWSTTADEHADTAMEAENSWHYLTAGDAWRQAAITRHFGKFVWTVDLDLTEKATRRCVQEMLSALRHLDPTAERLEIAFDGGLAFANLRRPRDVPRPAYVIVIPGLDSTKEEFFYLEQAFLDRGLATVTVDGPGQGETGLAVAIRSDYEVVVAALLDSLESRDDLDHDRVGVMGVSLGGYYAPRVAAFEERIKALVALSGPYRFGEVWDNLPSMTRSTFEVRTGSRNPEEARQRALEMSLEDILGRISVPTLYASGGSDQIIPWQQTARQAEETTGATFVRYPGGSHGLTNRSWVSRPMMADWLVDRLHSL